MLPNTWLIVCLGYCIIANTKTEDYSQAITRYQKTLIALHQKIDSVVNLEWRISKLESTLNTIEESRKGDDHQSQTVIDISDYSEYVDKREPLASINKTVMDALKKVIDVQTNVDSVQNRMDRLNEEISDLEEWRQKINLEEQTEKVLQMSKQMEDFDLMQQELNIMTRQLQNETHDLRGDVANVNEWVRRMKVDFQDVFDTIRANLSEIWKETEEKAFEVVKNDDA